jgi:hypothetical protein
MAGARRDARTDRVSRVVQSRHGLHEQDGVLRDSHTRLRRVLGVVEPNAQDGLRIQRREDLAHCLLLLTQRQVPEDVLLREELNLRREAGLGICGGWLADKFLSVSVEEAA